MATISHPFELGGHDFLSVSRLFELIALSLARREHPPDFLYLGLIWFTRIPWEPSRISFSIGFNTVAPIIEP